MPTRNDRAKAREAKDTCKGAIEAWQDANIDHPIYYRSHPSGIECIQVSEHMSFCIGNVIKYCWRAGLKISGAVFSDPKEKNNERKVLASRVQDLEKARWYLNREISRLMSDLDKLD